MTHWRYAVALSLLGALACPVAVPIAHLLASPESWSAWDDPERLLDLSRNTLLLVAGTVGMAVPIGVAAAVLVYRTDLPARRLFRFLLLLTLFVPLPLFASGWQAVLGSSGWLPWSFWNQPTSGRTWTSGWAPWGQGLWSAILIHATAALPWVILLVGQGLRNVEPELEEDALTCTASLGVLLRVTLPRCAAAIGAATVWVVLQTATEITVTDMMQVRTFAEEVYTQLVAGVDVARAVAVSLPAIVLGAFLVFIVVRAWDRTLPPLTLPGREAVVFRLGRWRFPAAVLLGIVGGVLLWIPLGSLCWRAGEGGSSWSMRTLVQHLGMTRRAESWTLLQSLLVAVVAGVVCAGWAAVVCWTCLDRRRWQAGLLIFLACVWAIPGPIIGLGLKDTLRAVTESSDSSLVNVLLWRGPSPLPLVWVEVIRFFPCAVALLWPVMRLTPPELRASAVTDGATPGQELALVVWPFHLRAIVGAALAVGILTLGELSAGKVVCTPGWPSYAETIWTQMHYGVNNDLAARCLWLLATVIGGGILLVLYVRVFGRRK